MEEAEEERGKTRMGRWKNVFFSPKFQYPVFVMVILIAASAWYYRVSVRRSETAVNERSLRVLAALAEEFSSRLAIGNIARQNWQLSKQQSQQPNRYGKNLPDLTSDLTRDYEICEPRKEDEKLPRLSGDKLIIRVKGDSPTCWSVSLAQLMASLEESLPKGVFDDLFLADDKGKVLYQTRRSGMQMTDLHPFFEQTGKPEHKADETGKNPQADVQQQPKVAKAVSGGANGQTGTANQQPQPDQKLDEDDYWAARLGTSKSTDVELGGEPYKLYTVLVPVQVDESTQLGFIFGGVLHAREFQTKRVAPLANTLVTIGLVFLLGAFGIYPVLRFRFMGRTEVLKRRAGVVYLLQMIFTAILVGGLAGHLLFPQYSEQHTDADLSRLAGSIEKNLEKEVQDALAMLDSLESFYYERGENLERDLVAGKTCSDELSRKDQDNVKDNYLSISAILGPDSDFSKYLKQNSTVLKQNPALPDVQYPYFDLAYFIDRAGYQEVKFSARMSVTPQVPPLCNSDGFSRVPSGAPGLRTETLTSARRLPFSMSPSQVPR